METFLGKGYFDGYNGSHFYLELWYELISQSTKNNTSTFRLLSYVGSQDGYEGHGAMAYIYPHSSTAGIIDSNVACGYYDNIPRNTRVGPGYSQNYTVRHADNGKLSLYVYTTTSNSWGGVGYASTGGTINFPDIARYPMIVQAPDFSDEDDPTITYTTALGFPNATVQAGIFSNDGNTAYADYRNITVEDASYTFNLTSEERTALRTATQGSNSLSVKFIIKTTTTDNETFTSVSNKTMTLINANPTIATPTFQETNANVSALLGTSATTIIENASVVRTTVVPTLVKEAASISKVEILHDGTTYTDNTSPYVLDIPITANSLNIKAIDSRNNVNNNGNGYTKTWENANYIEYQPVDITSLTMKRQNSTSSNIILNLEAKYYQKTFGSTANVPIVKWKLGEGSYTTIPSSAYSIDTTNNKLTITNYTLSNALVYTSNGTFTISLEDKLTTDTDSRQVLKGVATYDVGEHDLQVNGDLFIADVNRNNPINVKEEINKRIEKYDLETSGSPVKTGRKIDGYDEYVIRIDLGSLPNTSTSTTALGVTINKLTKIEGNAYRQNDNVSFPLPFVSNDINMCIGLWVQNNNLIVTTGADRSTVVGWANIYYI